MAATLFRARHLDFGRIAHELHRQLLDRIGERRREQQRLALPRQAAEHAFDCRQEAHVEHAVGLVEDQDFDAGQVDGPSLHMVDQAPGGGDENVHAAP